MTTHLTQDIIQYYILYYIKEVFEAVVALIIYKVITSQDIMKDYKQIVKGSLIIGVVTTLLENYNPEYKRSLKSGLLTSISNAAVKI
jgi:hypothetical protein